MLTNAAATTTHPRAESSSDSATTPSVSTTPQLCPLRRRPARPARGTLRSAARSGRSCAVSGPRPVRRSRPGTMAAVKLGLFNINMGAALRARGADDGGGRRRVGGLRVAVGRRARDPPRPPGPAVADGAPGPRPRPARRPDVRRRRDPHDPPGHRHRDPPPAQPGRPGQADRQPRRRSAAAGSRSASASATSSPSSGPSAPTSSSAARSPTSSSTPWAPLVRRPARAPRRVRRLRRRRRPPPSGAGPDPDRHRRPHARPPTAGPSPGARAGTASP